MRFRYGRNEDVLSHGPMLLAITRLYLYERQVAPVFPLAGEGKWLVICDELLCALSSDDRLDRLKHDQQIESESHMLDVVEIKL